MIYETCCGSKCKSDSIAYYSETVKSANTLLLVMKGTDMRLDASLQQMMREMEALFGDEMWDHVVVGVSFWSYDLDDVEERNKYAMAIALYYNYTILTL